MIDPVDLTAQLVRCESVTPANNGALEIVENLLTETGFTCSRIERGGISNLFARWGDKGHNRTFGFNGHTDVVPVGDVDAWSEPPFSANVKNGWMFGRGTTDMKSGVAAFAAAAVDFVKDTPPDGSLIITITGDEEGDAIDGTTAILDWMAEEGEAMSHCLVGEPTCPNHMGEMMKIGRRGSMTAYFTVKGEQGHSAYPHRAKNPLPAMARLMDVLSSEPLDQGTDHFDTSTLAVVTIDTGNPANNVIPAECTSTVNIRFNDAHTSAELTQWLCDKSDEIAKSFDVEIDFYTKVSGESFITPPGELSDLIAKAVQTETNRTPELSTSGGTSDARFIQAHCPVAEFGLVGKTMHQVDERVEVAQIHQLKSIYARILRDYFA